MLFIKLLLFTLLFLINIQIISTNTSFEFSYQSSGFNHSKSENVTEPDKLNKEYFLEIALSILLMLILLLLFSIIFIKKKDIFYEIDYENTYKDNNKQCDNYKINEENAQCDVITIKSCSSI